MSNNYGQQFANNIVAQANAYQDQQKAEAEQDSGSHEPTPAPENYTRPARPEFTGPPKGFGFKNGPVNQGFMAGWDAPDMNSQNAHDDDYEVRGADESEERGGGGFGAGYLGFHDISDGYFDHVEEPVAEEEPYVEEEAIVEPEIEEVEEEEEEVDDYDGPAFFHPDAVEARY